MSNVAEIVLNVLQEFAVCLRTSITPEAVLNDDLGLDSLDVVEIVMELESRLGIEISDEDEEKMIRVSDVVRICEGLKEKRE